MWDTFCQAAQAIMAIAATIDIIIRLRDRHRERSDKTLYCHKRTLTGQGALAPSSRLILPHRKP